LELLKKKKKKKVVEDTTATTATSDDAPWQGTNRDYSYTELLDRMFSLLREKNPNLSGPKKRYTLPPPLLNRISTKKVMWANFQQIYTAYVLLISPFLVRFIVFFCLFFLLIPLLFCFCSLQSSPTARTSHVLCYG
jgi:hypothetical protein